VAHHLYRFRVPFADVDHAGIVYYPRLFHYFHLAYESWFHDALHRPFAELFSSVGISTPVVRAEGNFLAPLRHGDEVEVEAWIAALGQKSWTLRFQLRAHGTLCAEGSVVHAFVRVPEMKSIEIPSGWRETAQKWLEETSEP
jgi:YbgC/YbaW family acyl-CoA thioester hydrolase